MMMKVITTMLFCSAYGRDLTAHSRLSRLLRVPHYEFTN